MNKQSELPANVANRVGSLRDFLQLLEEQGQFITWPNEVMPEPDIRNILVAAGTDDKFGPAIIPSLVISVYMIAAKGNFSASIANSNRC